MLHVPALLLLLLLLSPPASVALALAAQAQPCCSALKWSSGWVCPGCPSSCSVCHGSGNRSGASVDCSSIRWGANWECTDCPQTCTVAKTGPAPPPPGPGPGMPLHPFSATGAGDVNGPFFFKGTFHLFTCCSWRHLTAPTAAGPWNDQGSETAPAAGNKYISGSVTVVDGVPRAVMPWNMGNIPATCCVGPPSNGTWRYPCVANPPTASCFQSYLMSLATDPTDRLLKDWQPFDQQTTLVNYTAGHVGHGWVQQDPSRGWLDSAPHDPKRWLFIGGTSINGTQDNPGGVPIIELWGSRAGGDWAKGFEYLGIFSADGLSMCDPELITWPGSDVAALYVCSSEYLLGKMVPTATAWEFKALPGFPKPGGIGGGKRMAPVGGSAKGFWDEERSRYLIWHASAIRAGFSLAREVTVDRELEILIETPAREYEAMRQAPLVNATGLAVATAQQALDTLHGACGQLDVDVAFHFAAPLKQLQAGAKVGVAALGEAINLTISGAGQAVLAAGRQSMGLQMKGNETSIALRIIVDGAAIEAFAMDGRAGVSARAANSSGTFELLLAGEAPSSVDLAVFPLAFESQHLEAERQGLRGEARLMD